MSMIEPDAEPRPSAEPARPEATVRALVVGCGIGVVLAAGNVYTALKTGFIDSGSIMAALLGFVIFSSVKDLARRRYGPLENNITQTTAASAAIMSFVVGLPGPVAALHLMGMVPPGWAMAVWGAAAGLLGIAAAIVLRRKLIVDDALPFPTGRATAELIETIHTGREAAVRRAWLLAGAAAVAVAITWFREGSPKLIPQATAFGGSIAGVAVASLTLGMSWSPLLASTGALIGLRGAVSVLLGGAIAWGVLAPRLLNAGIVREAGFGPFTSWLAWPALGLLAAGSFLPLLLDPGSLRRSLRDLSALARGRSARPPKPGAAAGAADRPVGSRLLASLFIASVVTLVLAGRIVFGISPAVTLLAVGLALVLTNVSARATGETDVAPIGPVGILTQLAFAGAGAAASMVTGWASSGASAQACQALYAFRTGERVGASTRAQVGAQLLGCLLGAAVVVPVYFLLVRSYGIGTEALPVASAQSWKAMADAVRGGTAALPPHAALAGGLGIATGVILTLCARTRMGRFVPSPAAIGMGMLVPGSYALAIFAGALAVMIARRVRPGLNESVVLTVAAGGMAGESLMGVVAAALMAAGAL
jgi:uncharacterized oligopeptide transporter (OPT) family protein